jgi:sulfate-transporting ATPase
MSDVVRFAVLGLATGGLYSLLGLGLVVVHRASGVVNFANAAIAVAGAYVYDATTHGHPKSVAILLGIATGAALGLLTYVLVIRPLARASGLTKGIATLAVLVIVQSACTLRYGETARVSPGFLPTDKVKVLGAIVTLDQLIVLAVSTALVGVLTVVYRRTRFGVATSAVAENEFAFAILGHSAARVGLANWVIGGTLAGVAGVLIAPLIQIGPTQATALLVPALAVALAGAFSSFPIALAAGLLIGVGQSELTRYSTNGWLEHLPGLPTALPLIVLVVVLSLRGASLPARDFLNAALPRIGSATISRAWTLSWSGLALILVASVSDEWTSALTTGSIAGVLFLSLVVVTGYAGQLSLAQVSIAGIGVFVASKLVSSAGWAMPPAALVGIVATIPVAFLIGLPALRTRGITLAVVTLGLADVLYAMVFSRPDVNVEGFGMNVGPAKFLGFDIDAVTHPRGYAIFSLILLTVVAFAVSNLRRSRIGKVLVAVRSNERAAAGLGINVAQAKLYAFVVAGTIAGTAGILAAWRQSNVLFTGYDAFASVNAVVGATLGGIGYISGALVGGSLSTPGGVGGKLVTGIGLGEWLAVITGGLLLVSIVFNPDGVVPNTLSAVRRGGRAIRARIRLPRLPRWLGAPATGVLDLGHAPAPPPARPPGRALLEVRELDVIFGTTRALDGVSLQCRGGEVVGVIGPNGSGKTTLVDAITGYVSAEGSVELDGHALDGMPAHRRTRLGVSRSFQSLELFEDLNVADNLLVASDRARLWSWLTCFVRPGRARPTAAVRAAVEEFGLADVLDRHPRELPYGKRRLLAISRALSTGPKVVLLDEPAAGLDDADRAELRVLVRRLADDWGMAVLLVEHDVALVMDVSDRVVALEFGAKIAEGSPAEIRRHPEVMRSYLGAQEEATVTSSSTRLARGAV